MSHNLLVLSNTFPIDLTPIRIRPILSKTHFKLLSEQVGAITDTVLEKQAKGTVNSEWPPCLFRVLWFIDVTHNLKFS